MRTRSTWTAAVGAMALLVAATTLAGAAEPEVLIVIENHRFDPAEVTVPAGQKVRLRIDNRDGTPEEFESYALNREKVVPGKGEIIVYVGPLKPGRYEFFGEFNPDTARGWLVAR